MNDATDRFEDENPYAELARKKLRTAGGCHQASEARTNHAIEAQAYATLALALEQRRVLGELLGDDSHLDGLKQSVRDVATGLGGVEDRLEEIRNRVSS